MKMEAASAKKIEIIYRRRARRDTLYIGLMVN